MRSAASVRSRRKSRTRKPITSSLREDVELFAAEQKANRFKDCTVSRHQTVDGDHGRIETRSYTAFHDIAWLQDRHDWPGLKGVIMVESTRENGGKIEQETRFYITSLAFTNWAPSSAATGAIENSLHWVMDISSATTNAAFEPSTRQLHHA